MASLVAFFLAPPEESKFDQVLRQYCNNLSTLRSKTCYEEDEEFTEFKRWFDSLSGTVNSDIEAGNFIPQCESTCSEVNVEKQICGVVTNITDEGGLIDDFIYFNVNDVTGFENDDIVVVGDRVQVHAISTGSGWKALTISKLSKVPDQDWPEECAANVSESELVVEQGSMIGLIKDIKGDVFYVDEDLHFSLEDVVENFTPCIGDWVKAIVLHNTKITSVEPLRKKEIIGRVNYTTRRDSQGLETSTGSINNDVQFSFSVCEAGYWPRRNDAVRVIAIESKQSRYSWRATFVALLSQQKGRENHSLIVKPSDWVLRGEFPSNTEKRSSVPSFLPKYPIPQNVRICVENGNDILRLLPPLKSDLSSSNYSARFSALLYLEEICADIEIRKYNLYNQNLERRGEFLALHVPGITDGKPSLSVGDVVVLRESRDSSYAPEHHGFIHHIILEEEKLLVKFHATLHDNFEESEQFNVAFTYSRTPIRRCHLAVQIAQRCLCARMLFPDINACPVQKNQCDVVLSTVEHEITETTKGPKACYFNINLNTRQQQAVQRVICGEAKSLPYILFGPPGTGKTVTLVETILQLYHLMPWSRILVCAPSNSAVDVVCERLACSGKLKESDMTRFNAFKRLDESIPETIKKFCRSQESIQKTSRYRVILTTCVNAGILYSLQLPADHFTHACIDEAGQATEPEVLIPIGLVQNGQVIMAGDPEQLGAVIMSPLAKMYGLELSLLERMMLNCKLYGRNDELYECGYNPLLVTKLVNNYRSHSYLLQLPSKLFYKGELIPCASEVQCNRFLNWPHLPTSGFPILFHGILGQQLRESDCPSLMNPSEIVQAIRYVKLLISEEHVSTDEIGIITPYRKQVEKMRIMLKAIGVDGVKVGSVEEFQGQERPVILISTVRSVSVNDTASADCCMSTRSALGFVSNSKRFNVATTRAQSLMILLGNPIVLSLDSHWKELLQFCIKSGGYTGVNVSCVKL